MGKFTKGAEAVERGSSNVTLIGPQRFVKLFLDHYDDLAPEWRAKFPLKQVFVPSADSGTCPSPQPIH